MNGFDRVHTPICEWWLIVGFEDFRNVSGDFEQRANELQEHWRHANDRITEIKEQQERSKDDWVDQYKSAFEGDKTSQFYSTATSTTTHVTRNADGSVHKETITTERLSDGSTKTTRIVDTTPADGNSRTETTITRSPPPPPSPQTSYPAPSETEDKPWGRHRESNGSSEELENGVEADKKETNNSKNSGWWFWSRK